MLRAIVISFLICFAVSLNAQAVFDIPEHYVGARGGATASNVNFSPTVPQGMRFAFTAGAVYRMVTEKYFGFQVELNYVQRGWSESSTESPYDRLTGYLEIPFMTHITFGTKICKGFINLGPSVSLMLHESPVMPEAAEMQRSLKSRLVDYGIVGGLGFEVHTKAGVWLIDARYCFGLGDIFPSDASDYFRSSSNQNIILSLGWLMPVGRRDFRFDNIEHHSLY